MMALPSFDVFFFKSFLGVQLDYIGLIYCNCSSLTVEYTSPVSQTQIKSYYVIVGFSLCIISLIFYVRNLNYTKVVFFKSTQPLVLPLDGPIVL